MSPEARSIASIFAELASCRFGRLADRLIAGEREAAAELLEDARRAVRELEAALAAEDRPA